MESQKWITNDPDLSNKNNENIENLQDDNDNGNDSFVYIADLPNMMKGNKIVQEADNDSSTNNVLILSFMSVKSESSSSVDSDSHSFTNPNPYQKYYNKPARQAE